MYHISNNIRVLKSAELIQDALVECMKEKPFTDISVSDLQRTSGVSRATFYRLFDNVQDVLAYKCEQLALTLQSEYIKNKPEERENFILFSLRYWLGNYVFLDAVFRADRADILQHALTIHAEHLTNEFSLDNISKTEMDYIVSASMGILSSILMTWLKHGCKETAEQLYDMFLSFEEHAPSLLWK